MQISIRRALTFLLFCVFSSAPQAQGQAVATSPTQLTLSIDRILDQELFENAFWGVVVFDLNSGQMLYGRNEKKSFMPASNTKLYTTAAALDQLGPSYRYRTEVYVDGPVVNGILRGNLIVRGSGDPTIAGHYDAVTGKYTEKLDDTKLFRDWADSLRTAGIYRIMGDIVGDDDVMDDESLGFGWSWDDETYYYSAEMGGLIFNDNVVRLSIAGQHEGSPAAITWEPFNTDYVRVINKTVTISSEASIDEGYLRDRGTNLIHVSSLVPEGQIDTEEITVSNPTLFFAHVLRETLLRSGIPVEGDPRDVDAISIKPDYVHGTLTRIASHTSYPLSSIARMINKPSQNLYAEQLLKTLATERPVEDDDLEPGSTAMGLEAAKVTYARAGIDTSRVQLVDGSGLSRMNLITPDMTSTLLKYMWKHPDITVTTAFYDSLPIGGTDGSIQYRFLQKPALENVRAKTGSLNNVSSLSGYVSTSAGTPLAFVLMCNHYTSKSREVRAAQDEIVGILAGYGR